MTDIRKTKHIQLLKLLLVTARAHSTFVYLVNFNFPYKMQRTEMSIAETSLEKVLKLMTLKSSVKAIYKLPEFYPLGTDRIGRLC